MTGPSLIVTANQALATWVITLSPASGDTLPSLLTATSIAMHIYDASGAEIAGSPITATATSATTISCVPPALAVGSYTAQAVATWSDGGTSPSSIINILAVSGTPDGSFLTPDTPNIVDFLSWLQTSVEIPTSALPVASPWPQYALNQALSLVLTAPAEVAGIMYTLAVYNCATHILFQITPDIAGQNYFKKNRGPSPGFGLVQPSSGLVASTSDETDSTTLAVPDWAKTLTVGQLSFYKTPWGREYLEWQQAFGPNVVGLD